MINELPDIDLNYVCEGEGAPAVLLHGIAASRFDWDVLLQELPVAGYRAYALDLLGHGDSAKPQDVNLYNAEKVYASFENWMQRMDFQAPLLLVGHSFGGYLSLRYSLEHPDRVRGLVLINPFFSPDQVSPLLRRLNRRPRLGEMALRLAPEWLVNFVMGLDPTNRRQFSDSARQQIASDYKRASPHIMYIPGSAQDLTPYLQEIRVPSLLIWGNNDLTLKPSTFHRLLEALPDVAGYGLPKSGHQPHIGHPETVNPLVIDFARRLLVDDHFPGS